MRKTFTISIFATLAILLVCHPAFALGLFFYGEVIDVIDGDTIEVLVIQKDQGSPGRQGKLLASHPEILHVRLYGIDCPDISAPFGNQAKKFTSDLVFKKRVFIKKNGIDRYGRVLGDVRLELPCFAPLNNRVEKRLKIINMELLEAGYAWCYLKYAPEEVIFKSLNENTMKSLEESAKAAKRGLWADPDPIPPWEWRSKKE